jgi:hypothetical protein
VTDRKEKMAVSRRQVEKIVDLHLKRWGYMSEEDLSGAAHRIIIGFIRKPNSNKKAGGAVA